MAFADVTAALTNLLSVMGTMLDEIAKQPMLMAIMVVPVAGAGCAVWRKLVHSAR